MPHSHSGVGSDDLASSDEIKVFEDEGEDEEKRGELLSDEKSSLITDSEQEKSSTAVKHNGHVEHSTTTQQRWNECNECTECLLQNLRSAKNLPHCCSKRWPTNKVAAAMVGGPPHPGSPLSFMSYNIEFRPPPPAHMGIHYDTKTGIPRPPMYPLPTGQYSHSVFAELTQWHSSAMYPMASSAFRGPYLPNLTASAFPNFSTPSLVPPPHTLSGHPSLQQLSSGNQKHVDLTSMVASGMSPLSQSRHESLNGLSSRNCLPSYPHHSSPRNSDLKSVNRNHSGGSSGISVSSPQSANHSISSPTSIDINKHSADHNHVNNSNAHKFNHSSNARNDKHIKKPLNAFMLYMKDMRSKVVAECTLKESAAINQILGKRWHSLPREEQAKYYDMARKERQLHLQLYPGWTAKDNYAINQKKKKKKRDKSTDGDCNDTTNESEDNLNSVESLEAPTPDSKSATETDSDTLNVSPLGLSLSSPSVPNSEYVLPHITNRLSQSSLPSQSELTPRSQSSSSSSTLASLSCPPRNSPIGPNNPLSIEQLTRPHCPVSRTSAPSTPNSFISTTCVF